MKKKKNNIHRWTPVLIAVGFCTVFTLVMPGSEWSGSTGQSLSPLVNADNVFGCTIVMAARNGLVLAGNNEDRNHPQTIASFMPFMAGSSSAMTTRPYRAG
jgi:hypothetical protein